MTGLADRLQALYRRERDAEERHTLVLVGCAAQKLSRRARAIDLYTSHLFGLHVRYARLRYGSVDFILSARHGLIDAHEEVEPYDEQLQGGLRARLGWSAGVLGALTSKVAARGDLVVLAGASYIEGWRPFAQALGWRVLTPFAGTQIGERKRALINECGRIEAEVADARSHLKAAGLEVEDRGQAVGNHWISVLAGEVAVYDGTPEQLAAAVRSCAEEAA